MPDNKAHFSDNEYWEKNFSDLDLSQQTLSPIEFENCTFKACNFSETHFNQCKFIDCEFIQCNLSVVKLTNCKFMDVVFNECKIIGVNWNSVVWSSLSLVSPLKFYQCIINDSSFYGLQLPEIIIERCQAHNVDFREGDFSRAHFNHSDLSACLFQNTTLNEADFADAINYQIDIHHNSIKGAIFSRLEAFGLLTSLDIELVD